MPRTVHRLLVVLVLALALPVQGMAMSMGGICMALGHHGDADVQASGHDHDGASHEQAAGHAKDHDHNAPEKAHCPPCVSCCAAAAAISSATLPSLAQHPASAAIAELAHSISGALPDELDRPPLAL